MNEGLVDNRGSGRGPGEEDMEINGEVLKPTNDLLIEREERTDVGDNGLERTSQVLSPLEALAPSDSLDIQDHATSVPVMTGHEQTEKIPGGVAEEQPVDWFEPLEDDNYEDDTQGDAEEESVAGSERSGSVAGLEKKINIEEGWEDWPALGKGWKRKAVVRRSGSSVGQSDVYYMSPSNERVRSRVELSKVLADTLDMTMFDYKAGVFRGAGQPKPLPPSIYLKLYLFFHFTNFNVFSNNYHLVYSNPWSWIPCGHCRACLTTEDCGSCANCKKTLNPDTRKLVRCRKRKCKCPILKNSTSQYSDPEDFSVNVDIEDDDEEKRKRRSCGKCEACNSRTDCGTCDFCIDKPKFGGSNKKRQKCRLRQCQRQAMRHLLPFQLGQTDFGSQEGWVQLGRPRPHFTYSRKTTSKKRKTPHLQVDMEFTDDDDEPLQEEEDYRYMETVSTAMWRWHNRERQCLLLSHLNITQIFSLADSAGTSGIDQEHELLKLLKSIHSSALPTLWFAIMVEGPTLQLLQCSKLSHMVDTTVQIDPSFYYQICVQGQPLLLTHPLYEAHPSCLTSVPQVANLLLDLEKYNVCQGVPTKEQPFSQAPIIIERASTCDFLVLKETEHCVRCKALSCSY
uniref:Methyl-CpG binding domain protein 1b n=1 Tax=Oncorhynchus mykiss TaxID=8022 RepID=A0A8C7R7H0_ONCMY